MSQVPRSWDGTPFSADSTSASVGKSVLSPSCGSLPHLWESLYLPREVAAEDHHEHLSPSRASYLSTVTVQRHLGTSMASKFASARACPPSARRLPLKTLSFE